MKKIAIILMLLALCLCILPCYAEDSAPTPDAPANGESDDKTSEDSYIVDIIDDLVAPIGGADGPTAILVAESNGISFHPENFVISLSYMGTGMIGIFIVIGLIVLATVVLNKVFSDNKKKKSE